MHEQSPWPKSNQTLRDLPADLRTAAFFDSTWGTPYGRIEGFRLAGEVLYERMLSHPSERNFLIYPYANSWRHCLELLLKDLLPIITDLAGTTPAARLATTHNLAKLWTSMRPLVEKAFPAEEPAEIATVTRVIEQLTNLDPDGQSFRYHSRVDGKPTLRDQPPIDLPKFHEALRGVRAFLDAGTTGAYEQRETQRDIAREYGS